MHHLTLLPSLPFPMAALGQHPYKNPIGIRALTSLALSGLFRSVRSPRSVSNVGMNMPLLILNT